MESLRVPESRTRLYIAGGLGGSSVAPAVHEYIASSLGKNWTCEFLHLNNATEIIEIYRRPDFRGGIVTMPHKRDIIPLLDDVDDYVRALSACNVVYLTPEGRLRGTNTDWIGVRDTVLLATNEHIPGRISMVYGAGGAGRAAVFALLEDLKCSKVYVINRDKKEVEELIEDVSNYRRSATSDIVHIESVHQASFLPTPQYVVSTVPDRPAVTLSEIEAEKIFLHFISREERGLVIDMCYHPLVTRKLAAAGKAGWKTSTGVLVIANQLKAQWSLFGSTDIPDGAAKMLQDLATAENHRTMIEGAM